MANFGTTSIPAVAQSVAGFPNGAPIFIAHSVVPQAAPVAPPANNYQGQVVFSAPPMVKLTSFEEEFLRPTVAAENPTHASTLDQADGRLDSKFFGATVTDLHRVPHNNHAPLPSQQASIAHSSISALPSMLPSMSVLPSTNVPTAPPPNLSVLPPAGFTTATPPFSMASATLLPHPGLPAFSPTPTMLPTAGLSPTAANAASVGRVVVPATPQYRNITTYQDEFLRPTVAAKTLAEAQVLDAADGRVDSRFFGAQVVTR